MSARLYYYYPGAEKLVPGYQFRLPAELYGSVSGAAWPRHRQAGRRDLRPEPIRTGLSLGFGKLDNLYMQPGPVGLPFPDTGIGFSAGIGRTFTKSFLSGGKKYTDWSLGMTYTTGPVTLGVTYVDTSYAKNAVVSLTGKDIAKAGVFGSIGVAF
jgi:hypothetical protein